MTALLFCFFNYCYCGHKVAPSTLQILREEVKRLKARGLRESLMRIYFMVGREAEELRVSLT